MAETINMVEMEALLAADTEGSFREATLVRLRDQAVELKRRLDKGVSPEEYADLERVVLALETAASTVDRVWKQLHRRT